MANVVQKGSQLYKFLVFIGQDTGVNIVEVGGQLAGEVIGAQRVSKSVVGRSREHVLAGRKLLNGPQALKSRRVNDGRMRGRDQNVPVNLVPNDAVSTLHDGQASNRFFIALLGNKASVREDNA